MTPDEAVQRVLEADAQLADAGPTPMPLPVAGLESVVAGSVLALSRTDYWVPGLRERVGAVLRDVPIERLVDGAAGARPYRVSPPDGTPALRALTAVGLADTAEGCALVHLGVGSLGDGAFHEALNLAAQRNASVIFVIALHPLTGDSPLGPQLHADPATLVAAFGVPAVQIDGTDAGAVHDAVNAARERGGPTVVLAQLAGPSARSN